MLKTVTRVIKTILLIFDGVSTRIRRGRVIGITLAGEHARLTELKTARQKLAAVYPDIPIVFSMDDGLGQQVTITFFFSGAWFTRPSTLTQSLA